MFYADLPHDQFTLVVLKFFYVFFSAEIGIYIADTTLPFVHNVKYLNYTVFNIKIK